MKLGEIYKNAVQNGIEKDPRGKKEVESQLARISKDYKGLSQREKEYFDTERLKNPYSDTRILYGDPELDVKNIMVGIDIDVGELLLADRLRNNGRKIDLVMAHHPEGRAQARLHDMLKMQAEILADLGVPVSIAETLLDERSKEVERRLMPLNHTRVVDAARILDIPLICIHTPADNCVATYLQELFDEKKPETLDDVISLLMKIPEYQMMSKEQMGPKILIGSKEKKAGKIFVDMTGGTGGNKKAFEKLSLAGVDTIVGMHMSEDHRQEAKKHMMNVIIAGHIGSDTLGMNFILDALEKKEKLHILDVSGFRRVRRI
jgi:putative NIF3 family GTP cyclohydrolase 1 type 2